MATQDTMADSAARRSLKELLARFDCAVHQPDDPPLFTREPQSAMRSVHWRWSDLEPLLARLGEEIELGSGGQRRTLRLTNPGLPYGTTHTFWASIQVILPGEVAAAHRHTANAFRFIMKGGGATTTVDGERYAMNEGDLVLTPGGMWHDHRYDGDGPMIWLDVLDISLVRAMHAVSFEGYGDRTQPLAAVPERTLRQFGSGLMQPPGVDRRSGRNPLLTYPAGMAQEALRQAAGLEPDPFDDVVLEYRSPLDGGPAMRTMGMRLLMLRPGMRGKARRHTGSKLYYVIKGEGTSVVDGRLHAWRAGDFLAVRPWAWHEHANHSASEDAVLFQVDDLPAMEALGYYREEALSTNDGRQAIETEHDEAGQR